MFGVLSSYVAGDLEPEGPAWDLMRALASRGGFTIKLQLITNTSIIAANRSMDEWWGCVHEIAINNTDVCVGDFWVSGERAAYMVRQMRVCPVRSRHVLLLIASYLSIRIHAKAR